MRPTLPMLLLFLAPAAVAQEVKRDPGEWVEAWRSPLEAHLREVGLAGDAVLASGHTQVGDEYPSTCERSGLLLFSRPAGALLERRPADDVKDKIERASFARRLVTGAQGQVALLQKGRVLVFEALDRAPRELACDEALDLLAMSPDGRWLAAGGTGDAACLWDLRGEGPPRPLPGHGAEVLDLAFSLDGARLASVGRNVRNRVWSTATATVERTIDGPNALIPPHLVFGKDRLVTIGLGGELRSYALDTGAALGVVELKRTVTRATSSADGSTLAVCDSGGDTITVVRLDTCEVTGALPGGGTPWSRFALGPDGAHLAVAGPTLTLWRRGPAEPAPAKPAAAPPKAGGAPRPAPAAPLSYPQAFEALCFAADGGDLFAVEWLRPVGRLSVVAGQLEQVQRIEAKATRWLGRHDGALVRVDDAAGEESSVVVINALPGGAELARIPCGKAGGLEAASHQDRWLALHFNRPQDAVVIVDLKQRKVAQALAADPTALALHPKGKHLALGVLDLKSMRQGIDVLGLERGQKAQELPKATPLSMAYTADGNALHTVESSEGADGVAFHVRDAKTLRDVWSQPLGDDASGQAFDPRGRWFVYHQGGAARLLDLKRRASEQLAACESLLGVALSPDGKRLAFSVREKDPDPADRVPAPRSTIVRALPD